MRGGLVAEQLAEGVFVREIGDDAFFEEALVFVVELLVVVGLFLGLFFEEFEEAARSRPVELLHERSVLHRLARDVQRQIFAVDDAFEEAQPIGEEAFGFGLDENFAAVEVHLGFGAGHAEGLEVALTAQRAAPGWPAGASALKCRRKSGCSWSCPTYW